MILSPAIPDKRICASLFYRGVLPAFEDFVKFDPVAAKVASGIRGEVLFEDRAGNRAVLVFDGKGVRCAEAEVGKPVVAIQLGRVSNVVALVRGGVAFPLVVRGWFHPFVLARLAKLFLRFQRLLKPRPGDLRDDETRLLHVRLALAVALFSLAEVGKEDRMARQILADSPTGAVRFSVRGTDLEATVENGPDGLRPQRGGHVGKEVCRASVTFDSSKVAMEILTRKADAHGAVALGQIKVEGLVPLADSVNHVLDRVALYLPT